MGMAHTIVDKASKSKTLTQRRKERKDKQEKVRIEDGIPLRMVFPDSYVCMHH